MNKSIISKGTVIIAFILAFSIPGRATGLGLGIDQKKNFTLNPAVNKPELKFESTAPLEDIIGYVESANDISGSANINPANIEKSSGVISFKVKGLKTGISSRDEHMYGSKWLDADKYPEIKFEMENIDGVVVIKKDESKGLVISEGTAIGRFWMHGKSKSMEVPLKMTYLKESAATKKRAEGDLFFVEGEFIVALADFDVKGSKGIVGSKVGEEVMVSFKLFFSANNNRT